MRHARHSANAPAPAVAFRLSPQRAHAGPPCLGNSVQQMSQIGIAESRGREEPQRAQEAGRSAQLKLSTGLRSTRTTARQRVVCDGRTPVKRMHASLWKTHLAHGRDRIAAPRGKYTASTIHASRANLRFRFDRKAGRRSLLENRSIPTIAGSENRLPQPRRLLSFLALSLWRVQFRQFAGSRIEVCAFSKGSARGSGLRMTVT
jgi:hypothetical protein